jgi:uncharacterized membrane protein YeaQ/YmgE (transglycosylase-associated protein family)
MGIGNLISWIVFGLIVGAIARFLLPGRQAMGWIMTIILGMVGSFAGGFLATVIFGGEANGLQPSGWIMSIIGAVIVLFIYSRVAASR